MNAAANALSQPGDTVSQQEVSHIDWSAILAGAAVGTGIAFVFSTFGAGLGLSVISPYEGEGSALAATLAVGSWMLWTTVSSFMVGGYVAGRMRRRSPGVGADEAAIRDGIHGLTVWGVSILFGALLLGSVVDTTVVSASEGAAAIVAETTDTGPATPIDEGVSAQGNATDPAVPPALTGEEQRRLLAVAKTYAIISAFVTGVALLVAGAAAYWAAGVGGRHRDDNRTFTRFGAWT